MNKTKCPLCEKKTTSLSKHFAHNCSYGMDVGTPEHYEQWEFVNHWQNATMGVNFSEGEACMLRCVVEAKFGVRAN